MVQQLFSGSWYRVCELTPRLRGHAQIHQHLYRGERWYVLRDSANERFHRFSPATNYLIGLMDGERSVEEIWNLAAEELLDEAPTQDQVIELLGQLHAADVLQCDVSPDVRELFERWDKHEKQQLKSRLMSPFAIRMPLVDPEKFLTATIAAVRPIFSWIGGLVWLAVVVPAIILAAVHWPELTENLIDRVFAPQNLVIVWIVFPMIKILHELGHGYATKNFGGQVHDMGVMFLIFTPVPYVDASSSWAFSSKYKRALVGAGGMLVEVFIAALAFYVWLAVEPGATRSVAYNVIMIAGLTTILFNANPLLRFDGYFILSDLAELPNLRARANKYWSYLSEYYLFGNERAQAPRLASGEKAWFIVFPVAAAIYRIFIVVAIFSWILDQFFIIGLLLGLFAIVGWLGVPVYKVAKHLMASPELRHVRGRAITTVAGLLLAFGIGLSFIPMPLRTQTEGVVWIPEEAVVRSASQGFVDEIVAEPGAKVRTGDLLIRLADPILAAEQRRWRARVDELKLRHAAIRSTDVSAAEIARDELNYAREELARTMERHADLEIRSLADGTFEIEREKDWIGRFVHQGDLVAHVISLEEISVHTVVRQDEADLVRFETQHVDVRLAERIDEVQRAELVRIVPGASAAFPSAALGTLGGGDVPSDPGDPTGDHAMISFFEVELKLPRDHSLQNVGGRVYVRFDHGLEPLAMQWYRQIRQVFLSRFQV